MNDVILRSNMILVKQSDESYDRIPKTPENFLTALGHDEILTQGMYTLTNNNETITVFNGGNNDLLYIFNTEFYYATLGSDAYKSTLNQIGKFLNDQITSDEIGNGYISEDQIQGRKINIDSFSTVVEGSNWASFIVTNESGDMFTVHPNGSITCGENTSYKNNPTFVVSLPPYNSNVHNIDTSLESEIISLHARLFALQSSTTEELSFYDH